MPKEPKERVQFNVRLDGRQELVEAIKTYVANHGITMSEFVATALENALLTGVKPKNNQESLMVNQETAREERIALLEEEIAKIIQNASLRLTQLEERLGKSRRGFPLTAPHSN